VTESEIEIRREKTAIFRARLSTPMQMLLKHRFLNGDHTIFDYGSGRGDDLRALELQGVSVSGWDPFFLPNAQKKSADVVNLGFVLNVIENQKERERALTEAYGLAKKLLVVSVMLAGQGVYRNVQEHADGVVTSTKTFQKYYSQKEFCGYIENCLSRQPIVVAPGCVFVFRSDEDEQEFLAARHRHYVLAEELIKWALPSDKNLRTYERNKELLDSFWLRCLELGRIPAEEEYQEVQQLKEKVGSPRKALTILSGEEREKGLQGAALQRVDDLSVFFALNLFERRRSASALSRTLQRDSKAFFGTYKNAIQQATSALFEAGKPLEILKACQTAAGAGIGHLDGEKNLTLCTDQLTRLPGLLRIYVGCAAQLYGEIDAADLVKIHIGSAKLTLTKYDDFLGKATPLMLERIKIDMRNQDVDFFRYGEEFPPHPLYRKSRYMNKNSKKFSQQRKFDQELEGIVQLDKYGEFGPSVVDLERELKMKGKRIAGFQLVDTALATPRRVGPTARPARP
jgi:DNA phosphorothioation-associated putative methyltransferase